MSRVYIACALRELAGLPPLPAARTATRLARRSPPKNMNATGSSPWCFSLYPFRSRLRLVSVTGRSKHATPRE
jgi:hypothetical protein